MHDDKLRQRPFHVANRLTDDLPRVSALCHSRHDDDTLLPFDLPAVHRKKLTVDFGR